MYYNNNKKSKDINYDVIKILFFLLVEYYFYIKYCCSEDYIC